MKDKIIEKFMKPPLMRDVAVLAVFTALITLNPFFMHGKINLFEVGLYLPGIQSVLNGEIPYRDVFHLRGPFELYMPAFLMKLFGVHLTVLYSYFYFGNVLCLVLCILIAKELLRTRYMLYLFTPVLIGRTFPRVVFTYWGGMRYAFGLLALWFLVKFFKENKLRWIFGAGIISALAGFTSVEMGAYPFLGTCAAFAVSGLLRIQKGRFILQSFGVFAAGLCLIAVPYLVYLSANGALLPYMDAVWTIVTRMQKVIDPHFVSVYPRNFPEALSAMVNPVHTNFKHMTPSYLYIFILVYLIGRFRKKLLSSKDLAVICLSVYGFIMYNTGFRGIWAAQFEMALQPEKILLFFLLEIVLLMVIERKNNLMLKLGQRPFTPWYIRDKWKVYLMVFLLVGLFFSSIGYAAARDDRRFFAYQWLRNKITGKSTVGLRPLAGEASRTLRAERAKGILVPLEQADEIEQVDVFVQHTLRGDEALMTYPEMGTYNFLVNQKHFGRFPLATFTWFNDRWHEEYMEQLRAFQPRYIIVEKEIPSYWKDVYLALEPNQRKFREVMDFISSQYTVSGETVSSLIYHVKP